MTVWKTPFSVPYSREGYSRFAPVVTFACALSRPLKQGSARLSRTAL
jgi:hypothetical protein